MSKVDGDTYRVAIGRMAIQITDTCPAQLDYASIKPRTTYLGALTSTGGWLSEIRKGTRDRRVRAAVF